MIADLNWRMFLSVARTRLDLVACSTEPDHPPLAPKSIPHHKPLVHRGSRRSPKTTKIACSAGPHRLPSLERRLPTQSSLQSLIRLDPTTGYIARIQSSLARETTAYFTPLP